MANTNLYGKRNIKCNFKNILCGVHEKYMKQMINP